MGAPRSASGPIILPHRGDFLAPNLEKNLRPGPAVDFRAAACCNRSADSKTPRTRQRFMSELWDKIPGTVAVYSGRIVGAVLILLAGWLAHALLIGPLRRSLDPTRPDRSSASFLANSARSVLLVVILLAVLQQLGVETTSLLTLLGAAGLAVALSLQTSLANFASGLVILAFRLVRVGDEIEIGDVRGRV